MSDELKTKNKYIHGGVRDKKAPRHWRVLNTKFLLNKKPKKIIILPGISAVTAKQVNGMCKIMGDMLSPNNQLCELCGFYYEDKSKSRISVVQRAEELLNYFVPLVAKQDKFGDLQRLSSKEAAENMRNVIVATHCYGSRIIDVVDKKLDELMKEIGYQDKEIDYIHRQLFVIHQNTPIDDLGISKHRSTNLYRVSQTDENNQAVKYPLDSFPYYLLTEKLEENEVLLSSLNPEENVLIVPQISARGESEHNGAYWSDIASKTEAGKQEEQIAKAILNEVVSSSYPIENIEQIIKKAASKEDNLTNKTLASLEYGQELADDYYEYVTEIREERTRAMQKLKQKQLSKEEIEQLSPEALFLRGENGINLFEQALKSEDYKTAGILWQNMRKEMPRVNKNDHIQEIYQDESSDFLDAWLVHRHYVQKALETDNIEMFKSIVQDEEVLFYLDYKQAKGKTAQVAQKMCRAKGISAKQPLAIELNLYRYSQNSH